MLFVKNSEVFKLVQSVFNNWLKKSPDMFKSFISGKEKHLVCMPEPNFDLDELYCDDWVDIIFDSEEKSCSLSYSYKGFDCSDSVAKDFTDDVKNALISKFNIVGLGELHIDRSILYNDDVISPILAVSFSSVISKSEYDKIWEDYDNGDIVCSDLDEDIFYASLNMGRLFIHSNLNLSVGYTKDLCDKAFPPFNANISCNDNVNDIVSYFNSNVSNAIINEYPMMFKDISSLRFDDWYKSNFRNGGILHLYVNGNKTTLDVISPYIVGNIEGFPHDYVNCIKKDTGTYRVFEEGNSKNNVKVLDFVSGLLDTILNTYSNVQEVIFIIGSIKGYKEYALLKGKVVKHKNNSTGEWILTMY